MNNLELDIHEAHDAENITQLINRFKKYGEIIHTIERGDEFAKIGKIKDENIFLVFYPDGNFDRFDNVPIIYREGWTGPELQLVDLESTNLQLVSPETSTIINGVNRFPQIRINKVPNSIKKMAATKKKPAKRSEAVTAWFALLGSEKPKQRVRKPTESKKPSKSSKAKPTKH